MKENSPLLSVKVLHVVECALFYLMLSLPPRTIQQALDRDRQCIFSGVMPSRASDPLVASWVFPPFLGYKASVQYISEPSHLC